MSTPPSTPAAAIPRPAAVTAAARRPRTGRVAGGPAAYRPRFPGPAVPGSPLNSDGTTSRNGFGCEPGERTGAWSASALGHHRAPATGEPVPGLPAPAGFTGLELTGVFPG